MSYTAALNLLWKLLWLTGSTSTMEDFVGICCPGRKGIECQSGLQSAMRGLIFHCTCRGQNHGMEHSSDTSGEIPAGGEGVPVRGWKCPTLYAATRGLWCCQSWKGWYTSGCQNNPPWKCVGAHFPPVLGWCVLQPPLGWPRILSCLQCPWGTLIYIW